MFVKMNREGMSVYKNESSMGFCKNGRGYECLLKCECVKMN